MDIFDILSVIDLQKPRFQPGHIPNKSGVCSSCGRTAPYYQDVLRLCRECDSLAAEVAPRSRFNGLFIADVSGARVWCADEKNSYKGKDVTIHACHNWLAEGFAHLLNATGKSPYIVGLNTGASTFTGENVVLNADEDLIRFSGPRDPVTIYRDGWQVRRSAVREALSMPTVDRTTVAGRFASVVRNAGLSEAEYKKSKEIKKWTL